MVSVSLMANETEFVEFVRVVSCHRHNLFGEMPLPPFKIELLVFFLLSYESSLYVLDINPSSDI